ncbi:MAG: serine/threonine protein kinase [Deltaproteobacteria bacterium]|nr:serine/threonine protein kinase [Deltaproteobacteria bacterium]
MTDPTEPVDPETPTMVAPGTPTRGATAPVERSAPVIGGYELGEMLGRGGMGEVLLAHDPDIGRDVALKRMRGTAPSAEHVERFLREAKIQARLDHPAIVPVHDLGKDQDGLPFFTMKRLTGTTLAALLEGGVETQQRLLRAIVDVCQAVAHAHARHVVHRDLKPANIMLGDYGEVYVLDWGVARVIVDTRRSGPLPTLDIASLDGDTKTGALLGTPGYMAPEQIRGDDVLPSADVYAIGSMLFEVLAGEPLHPRGGAALATTIAEDLPLSPARRRPDRVVPPELEAVCVAALDMDPAARPTARALAERIQRYLDGDRDVERRKLLAAEQLDRARESLASGDPARRGDAVFRSGRALVLDPGSHDAAVLLTELLIKPPPVLPAELEASVAAEEARLVRDRSKRAVIPLLAFFLVTPALPWLQVISYPALIAIYLSVAAVALTSWVNWRVRAVPVWIFVTVNLVLTVTFSRLLGPFVLTPLMVAGVLLAVTPMPWVNERRWFVILYTALLVLTPFALEAIGILPRTWWMDPEGLVSSGNVFRSRDTSGAVAIVIGYLAFALVIGAYSRALSRDRRAALRDLHIQAWHLKQLLPRMPSPHTVA